MARLILRTGKGEVGKATIVEATKLLSAEISYRTPYPITGNDRRLADFLNIYPDSKFQPISPKLYKQKSGKSNTLTCCTDNIQKILNKYEEV